MLLLIGRYNQANIREYSFRLIDLFVGGAFSQLQFLRSVLCNNISASYWYPAARCSGCLTSPNFKRKVKRSQKNYAIYSLWYGCHFFDASDRCCSKVYEYLVCRNSLYTEAVRELVFISVRQLFLQRALFYDVAGGQLPNAELAMEFLS